MKERQPRRAYLISVLHGMLPSISRTANPYDHAVCESSLKTLKRGKIHAGGAGDNAWAQEIAIANFLSLIVG